MLDEVSTARGSGWVVASSDVKASFLQRVCAALYEPVDISFLVFFRIVFGGIMLWEVYRYFSSGWITRYFVAPAVNFTYYGFSWVKPWPGRGMYIHFFVLGLAAACVMAGVPLPHCGSSPLSYFYILFSAGPDALHESLLSGLPDQFSDVFPSGGTGFFY